MSVELHVELVNLTNVSVVDQWMWDTGGGYSSIISSIWMLADVLQLTQYTASE